MTRIYEALFLLLTAVSLTHSSKMWFLGIISFLFIGYALYRHLKGKAPEYKKSVAYAVIVPFFLWWVMSPTNGSVFSPWLLIIPAWYFMFLAMWQFFGEGRGGYSVFVIWNGIFVLLLSLRDSSRIQLVLSFLAFLALALYAKPPKRTLRFCIFFLLSIAVSVLSFISFQKLYEWRSQKMRSGAWEEEYRNERSMMGFSTVASLGSFKSNYMSKRNSQVVLRLWSNKPPKFLRAIAYKDYSGGIWSIPRKEEWLLPDRYIGDYAVFDSKDSLEESVWVQSSLNTFEFAFAPYGAGVAFHAADSIKRVLGFAYKTPGEEHNDWYYVNTKRNDSTYAEAFLNEPQKLKNALDTICNTIGIKKGDGPMESAEKINRYFSENFTYTLNVPFKKGTVDPLLEFWNYKTGFCEYFASLETLLLRHIGVPARYVTGFAWPTVNASKEYSVLRRYNAHAWVEVFNGFWKISDPTPMPPDGLFNFEISKQDAFIEYFKSKAIRFLHILRNGDWRKSLDNWSVILESLLQNVWLKVFLVFLLSVFITFLKYKQYKSKQKNAPLSIHALKYTALLDKAEKSLSKFGLHRKNGETELAFLNRIKSSSITLTPRKKRKFDESIEMLIRYDKMRWK